MAPGGTLTITPSAAPAEPIQGELFPREDPEPDLASYDIILANISGGKDSQTMLRQLVAACTAAGVPLDRIVCVFADLGKDDEWPGTEEIARLHAEHYGLRFITVCRTIADRVTGERRQQGLLEYILHRGMWPDAKNRFCTSDLKRGPILTVMTRLVGEVRASWRVMLPGARRCRPRRVRVLNVMGLRAQESVTRRLMAPFEHDEKSSNQTCRHVDEWLPIHRWTAGQVWADIHASGVPYHFAYDLGMPRLSCVFCVLASGSALVLAARHHPDGARKRLLVERIFAWRRLRSVTAVILAASNGTVSTTTAVFMIKRVMRSGPTFQNGRSMADVIARAAAEPAGRPVQDWAA